MIELEVEVLTTASPSAEFLLGDLFISSALAVLNDYILVWLDSFAVLNDCER